MTGYALRHLFGGWRFPAQLLCLCLLLFSDAASTVNSMSYNRFNGVYNALPPDKVALAYGLEGHYETLEEVWDAFHRTADASEYYFLCAFFNSDLSGFLCSLSLCLWVVLQGVRGRCASALLQRGCSRFGVFARMAFPVMGMILLLRGLICAFCLYVFPLRWELLDIAVVHRVTGLWLLFIAGEASVYLFLSFALTPFAAVAAGLAFNLCPALLPPSLRRFLPSFVTTNKQLWRSDAAPALLRGPAAAAAVILVLALTGAWLAFRKKELR